MNISVLGDGAWGTTLAILLSKKGYSVTLWSAFSNYALQLKRKRINTKYLPGIKIPAAIYITSNLKETLFRRDLVILAIPSQYLRKILKRVKKLSFSTNTIFISVIKGIETHSLQRMSEIIKEELGDVEIGVLSGPTIAHEVASGIPTTAVAVSTNKRIRELLQSIFMTGRFRVYTNNDLVGVELGGSLKNIIAIACGISDGLGFGTNTKAAILSRGLVEMSKLGDAMGAKAKTFSGISGLGDLVTTCISPYSRNRFVGEEIGKGKTLRQVRGDMQISHLFRQAGIAEGILTAKSAYGLSLKYKIDMPITREVYNVLYKNKFPLKAVEDLMTRRKKEE